MKHWRFMAYCAEGKTKPAIETWYDQENRTVQAEFDAVLRTLEVSKDWDYRKDVELLTKKHKGLFEIRFTVGKTRYRPVGFFYQNNQCVLVVGCKKPQREKYVPADAFDKALRYRNLFLERGKGKICEYNF